MPDRLRARVLVTALLIMLTVAGIRAIGPAGDWARPAGDVVGVGLLLEALLVAMFIALRWRRDPPAADLAGRLHRIVSAALVTSFLGVLIGLVLYEYNIKPDRRGYVPGRVVLRPTVRITPRRVRTITVIDLPPLRDVLIALLIIAIIIVLIVAWRRRRIASLRLSVPADLGVDEAADDLARAVESGRIALRDLDDARAAIIACYVAMEQTLAEAGAARGAAETPDELLVRAVAAGLVPAGPAALLTELFYEARYSTHHMPTSKRDQAEQALTEIAAGLPASERA
ncbi:MAG TPA: DUF4129 domain-containing protein [Streptosporangiaceae bacterium]|nr:DUF4129 domain-containing protein [Streptosporangiaceae bacterium]